MLAEAFLTVPLNSGILSVHCSPFLINLSYLGPRNLYLLIRIPFKLFLYAFILNSFRVLVIVGFFVRLTTLFQQQRLLRQYGCS